jgi:hypothetical protein
MGEVSIIGVDLAKNMTECAGSAADRRSVFASELSRLQFARFMAQPMTCLIAVEACVNQFDFSRIWAGCRIAQRWH